MSDQNDDTVLYVNHDNIPKVPPTQQPVTIPPQLSEPKEELPKKEQLNTATSPIHDNYNQGMAETIQPNYQDQTKKDIFNNQDSTLSYTEPVKSPENVSSYGRIQLNEYSQQQDNSGQTVDDELPGVVISPTLPPQSYIQNSIPTQAVAQNPNIQVYTGTNYDSLEEEGESDDENLNLLSYLTFGRAVAIILVIIALLFLIDLKVKFLIF